MSDFISGIGFVSDLKHIGLTEDGYPIVQPGYCYIENEEYYVFASGQIQIINASGIVENCNYIPGSPYFIVENIDDVDEVEIGIDVSGVIGITKVLDTSNNLISEALPSGWDYNDLTDNYDFYASGFGGGYLVYDTAEEFIISKDFVENTTLVLSSDVDTSEPFNIDNKPIWLTAGNIGREVPFYAKVIDNKGALLRDESIDWYKVYTKPFGVPPSGVGVVTEHWPSGVLGGEKILNDGIPYSGAFGEDLYDVQLDMGSFSTNENGIVRVDVIPSSSEKDLFMYFQHEDLESNKILKSDLVWIQVHIPTSGIADVFQLDNEDIIWSSREAMTAVGLDAWGVPWASGDLMEGYNDIPTGNEDYPTRGEWKYGRGGSSENISPDPKYPGFPQYKRPPMDAVAASDFNNPISLSEGGTSSDEHHGWWSGSDYYPSGVLTCMLDKRCAIKGYWGHFLVSGHDIQTAGIADQCRNPFDDWYIINPRYDLNEADDPTGYLAWNDYWGDNGTLLDVKNGGAAYDRTDWYYVLYAPDYDDSGISWFQNASNSFWFRGFAIPNTDQNSPDYKHQDYTIEDFISTAKLQE